jgi:hypothetical protein
MLQVLTKVEVLFHKELSEYDMRRLAEAIDLCEATAEVKINDALVNLQDLFDEKKTWPEVWKKFDEEKLNTNGD